MSSESRCPEHRGIADRASKGPWEAFYSTREWQAARTLTKRRDDYRCTWSANGRRCSTTIETGFVSVHHIRKLRDLWADVDGDWQAFVKLATQQSNLTTLCVRHHKIVDSRQGNAVDAYKGVSDSRRRKRHAVRKKSKRPPATRDRRKDKWLEE